jgi:hypothetical protein
MRLFDLFSALLPAGLQAAVAVIFARRKLYDRFPLFFGYTLYSIGITAVRLAVMKHPSAFYVLYWTTEMVYGILALLALRETFRPALRTAFGDRWSNWLPLLALLTLVGVSVWRAIYHPAKHAPGYINMARLSSGAYAFVPGILCLETIVLLWCMLLELKTNPPPWGRYRAGVLVGFGFAACATVAIYLARFQLGPAFEFTFRYAPPLAYTYAAVIWLKAFYREEPTLPKAKPPAKNRLRAALRFIGKAKQDLDKGLHSLRFSA